MKNLKELRSTDKFPTKIREKGLIYGISKDANTIYTITVPQEVLDRIDEGKDDENWLFDPDCIDCDGEAVTYSMKELRDFITSVLDLLGKHEVSN